MSDLYNASPSDFGGFTSPVPGGSTSAGYYQQPMNLPFTNGRSILATIPEYQRNPFLLEKDILFKYSEGRNNLMKLLLEYAEANGSIEVPDVRFRVPIEVKPNERLYLATGAYTTSSGVSTLKIQSNSTPIATAKVGGSPKQVGDIANLEVDQFVLLMFSWVEPRRTGQPALSNKPLKATPLPELAKITSIDYKKGTIKVTRNWAGEQRTSTPTDPATFTVVANSAIPGAGEINAKYAFVVPMAKSVKEDEIDAKVKNFTNSWAHGILQRNLMAWGGQRFSEIISSNFGIESPTAKSKRLALEGYYNTWEWSALFSEKSEEYDAETGYWSGTSDGILANIPKSHFLALRDIDYSAGFTGSSTALNSFHPLVFNKMLQGKFYIGSQNKVLVCGGNFHTSFTTMINYMTQQVPEIKSEWRVEGNRFKVSDGGTVDVVLSDKMSLNGFSDSAVLIDKSAFKTVKLRNYPTADIYEIQNENPLKTNGFVHGVRGFIDLMPDAHWVFTLAPSTDTAVDITGTPLE